ncbi:MAG TPA: MarR family transcriptional regulator [Stellaceae bacterium]|nr:MarR family transcriptional regulator [Stellaceae bacterium]
MSTTIISEPVALAAWSEPPVDRTFGFLAREVVRLLKRRFERRARQTGLPLTRLQAMVVLFLSRHEGVSQAEVAARLDFEPIALVRMLDKLCEEGLVERRLHPTDRRVRTLWLTPAARPVVALITQINEAIREEAFAGLSAEARALVVEALAAIKDNLALQEEAAAADPGPPPVAGHG